MKKSNILFLAVFLTVSGSALAAGTGAATQINSLINSVTEVLRAIALGVIVLALSAGAISHILFKQPVASWLKPVLIGGAILGAAGQIGVMLTSTSSAGF